MVLTSKGPNTKAGARDNHPERGTDDGYNVLHSQGTIKARGEIAKVRTRDNQPVSEVPLRPLKTAALFSLGLSHWKHF